MVIVHQDLRKSSEEEDVETHDQECSCTNQIKSNKLINEPRKRHNATQTPTSLVNWEQRSVAYRNIGQCCCNNSCPKQSSYCANPQEQICHCHRLTTSTSHCCHYQLYKHHKNLNRFDRSRSTDHKGVGDFSHQWPPRSFHRKHKRCTGDRRHRHSNNQAMHKICSSMERLPNTCTKSSLDSSDEHNHRNSLRLSSSTALHEIAIEIDAATMTEDNSTTATSNFAFKVGADSTIAPIIRAPLHVDLDAENGRGRLKRHSSINSNTTVETDELSNEDPSDSCHHHIASYRCQCGYWHCCEHSLEEGEQSISRSLVAQPKNVCVKIKRKRFIATDDCSSCSRCSSCSCSHAHTSSCSSFEEWSHSAPTHTMPVSVDCHLCSVKRHSTVSNMDYLGTEDNLYMGEEVLPQPLIQETTDSSAHTSRRSSVTASFCSCTSNVCYCCEDSATQMCTAQDASLTTSSLGKPVCLDGEEQHSSTLTPLTNPSSAVSTPVGDDGDVTMRSLSQALTDDTSSQSYSAEYYSLSSNQQQSQGTPCKSPKHLPIPPKEAEVSPANADQPHDGDDNSKKLRKTCKHFGKHHRHKRPETPTDSYL